MDIYQTEDEQVEALKKWWQENGKSAIFGVLLGLSAIFGWREWQDYQLEMALAASVLYQELVVAERDQNPQVVSEKAEEISSEYPGTAYAVFARLSLAKLAVENNELDSAAGHLRWAEENNKEKNLAHVIRLRLAQVLVAQEKYTEALALLQGLDRGKFAVSYQELEADIYRLQDNVEAAREAYTKALNLAKLDNQDTTLIDMKLDDLGRSTTE